MKTLYGRPGMYLAVILLGVSATPWAWADGGGVGLVTVTADGGGGGGGGQAVETTTLPMPMGGDNRMVFRTLRDGGQGDGTPKAWLGVGVEETSEVLAAQLGLKPGEGLVVDYVSSNSPAALAGVQKNDVLVDLDGQMLVDATQLRKLVQMHAIGEEVKISFYHAGKKQSASAKLNQNTPDDISMEGNVMPDEMGKLQLQGMPDMAGGGKGNLNLEIQRTMQQAQMAIQRAMRQQQAATLGADRKLAMIDRSLGSLADGGVSVSKNATVVVKNEGDTVRTEVRKDDSGSYVIVADPMKYLTAHDAEGKLLFDGAIETPAQQQKVPKKVWEKVAPMVEQLSKDAGSSAGGEGGTGPDK